MRRNLLWALSTLSALVLLLGYRTSLAGAGAAAGPPAPSSAGSFAASAPAAGASGGGSSGSGGTDPETPTPTADPTPQAGAARTVAGDVVSTRWGPVQVQITVSGSRITQASVLQYPQGNPRDVEINDYALPQLTQETVDAQSASIAMVSGATVTSDGYVASLQSALDQAGL